MEKMILFHVLQEVCYTHLHLHSAIQPNQQSKKTDFLLTLTEVLAGSKTVKLFLVLRRF